MQNDVCPRIYTAELFLIEDQGLSKCLLIGDRVNKLTIVQTLKGIGRSVQMDMEIFAGFVLSEKSNEDAMHGVCL